MRLSALMAMCLVGCGGPQPKSCSSFGIGPYGDGCSVSVHECETLEGAWVYCRSGGDCSCFAEYPDDPEQGATATFAEGGFCSTVDYEKPLHHALLEDVVARDCGFDL